MNFPLDRGRGLAAGVALLVVVSLAAFAVAGGSPAWTMVFAGGLLLAAGFVVMAPCQLQMSAMLTVVLRNLAARETASAGEVAVRRSAVVFALGYGIFYVPVAVALGGAAWLLGGYGWVLALAGGAMAVVLGLSALGVMGKGWLARCRGPLYLIRSGRASFQKPFSAGIAFGQYCATCCGPYLYALVVLAGATGSFALGSGLVMLYAAAMVVPFLLPVLLAPGPYAAVMDAVRDHGATLDRATGLVLVGMGLVLVPVSVLLAVG